MRSETPTEHDQVPVSTKDAAAHLHVTPATVRRRLRRGQLPGTKNGYHWEVWLAPDLPPLGDVSPLVPTTHVPAGTWQDLDPSPQDVVAMLRERLRERPPEVPRRPLWFRLLAWRG